MGWEGRGGRRKEDGRGIIAVRRIMESRPRWDFGNYSQTQPPWEQPWEQTTVIEVNNLRRCRWKLQNPSLLRGEITPLSHFSDSTLLWPSQITTVFTSWPMRQVLWRSDNAVTKVTLIAGWTKTFCMLTVLLSACRRWTIMRPAAKFSLQAVQRCTIRASSI